MIYKKVGFKKYVLTEDIDYNIFCYYFKAVSRKNGKTYISANGNYLRVHKGYQWNGCTGAIDTKSNLRASLLHDALYQLIQCGWKGMTYKQADELFYLVMKSGGFKFARLYYIGVRLFGFPWRCKKSNALIIKEMK